MAHSNKDYIMPGPAGAAQRQQQQLATLCICGHPMAEHDRSTPEWQCTTGWCPCEDFRVSLPYVED